MSVEELSAEGLSLVSQLAQEMSATAKTIAELEASLKVAKEAFTALEQTRLPEAMANLGVTELKLADGSKISIKIEYHASIPKAKMMEALDYLRDHEFGDLIKTSVEAEFGKGEDAAAQALWKRLSAEFKGRPIVFSAGVHPRTLKALVKEQFESGQPLPEELFGIYINNRAVIKQEITK